MTKCFWMRIWMGTNRSSAAWIPAIQTGWIAFQNYAVSLISYYSQEQQRMPIKRETFREQVSKWVPPASPLWGLKSPRPNGFFCRSPCGATLAGGLEFRTVLSNKKEQNSSRDFWTSELFYFQCASPSIFAVSCINVFGTTGLIWGNCRKVWQPWLGNGAISSTMWRYCWVVSGQYLGCRFVILSHFSWGRRSFLRNFWMVWLLAEETLYFV